MGALHVAVGGSAAVVTSDLFATQAALRILKQGGSATDALVAAAAVQCVVENGSTTIAGFWTSNSFDIGTGITTTVTGKIGAAAGEPYDYAWESAEAYSGAAMPVPGWPAGAHRAWEISGRLGWSEILQPAIAFAEDGFELDPATYMRVRSSAVAARTEAGRRLWMRDGRYLEVGETVRQPALAQTLRDLAEGGPGAFYEGAFAQEYVRLARELGGHLTMADLAGWRERARSFDAPLVGDYFGYEIGSEGALLVYALHLCQAANIGSLDDAEAAWAQFRILEETFHATREYSSATHDRFIDPGYAAHRLERVLNGPLRPTSFELFWTNTNTLVVRDADGSVAWLVHSINTPNLFGAGILAGGAYAVRAVNGDHARTGDLLAPGLFSKVALFREGKPYAIAASPGASCVHSPLAFLVALVQRRLEPAAAVAAPRFALPGPLTADRHGFESHYPRAVFAMLEERGVPYFECSPSAHTGRVTAMVIEDERVTAVHDARSDGAAAVL